jgi:phage protein D
MARKKLLLASGLIAVAVLFSACAKPPEAEIKDATAAVDEVRTSVQADKWAPTEYAALKSSLDAAQAEVDTQNQKFALMRNYDKAKQQFADVKAQADKVRTQAIANKEAAKQEANTRLQEASAAIAAAREALTKAPKTKDTRADIQLFTSDIDGLDASISEVNTMISSEDYKGAAAKAAAITQSANDIAMKLNEAAEKAAARRRR